MIKDKHVLILFCKTYAGDFLKFHKLFSSYTEHNVDNIPLYVSVPRADVKRFRDYVGRRATVISDESYAGKYFTDEEYWGLSSGYINQEICKLAFWEKNVTHNYLCVDSDAYFIRDFYLTDFIASGITPYSVLVMDKDLNIEHEYKEFGEWRRGHIKTIFKEVGNNDRRLLTCHGMTVLNASVLKDFKDNFIEKKGLRYKDLIKIAPYEFTWYNAWLQKAKVIPVLGVEPFFKTFHLRKEYELSRVGLIYESDLASYYVGIILNSNWKPIAPPDKYKDPDIWVKLMYRLIGRLT